MTWDVGVAGLGLLAAMSVTFGALAQVLTGWRTARRLGAIAAGVFFVAGLLISEVAFGWADEEDLQPNYDGLSVDEALLAVVPATVAVLVLRRPLGRRHEAVGR